MKLCRFRSGERVRTGVLKEGVPGGGQIEEIESLFNTAPTGLTYPLAEVQLLAPCQPGKIVCAGVNYRHHRLDGHPLPEEPILFLKPSSAATGPEAPIPYPAQSEQVDFEGELALVIGTAGYQLAIEQAPGHILGYCCANDVTARDIQLKEHNNFGRAKSFCGFAPFGPWIETAFDPTAFTLQTRLNGALVQSAHADELLFSPAELVAFISRVMPLEPGDLILTGTPRGMGPMEPGDRVSVTITGLGTLTNTLGRRPQRAAPAPARFPFHPTQEVPHDA